MKQFFQFIAVTFTIFTFILFFIGFIGLTGPWVAELWGYSANEARKYFQGEEDCTMICRNKDGTRAFTVPAPVPHETPATFNKSQDFTL